MWLVILTYILAFTCAVFVFMAGGKTPGFGVHEFIAIVIPLPLIILQIIDWWTSKTREEQIEYKLRIKNAFLAIKNRESKKVNFYIRIGGIVLTFFILPTVLTIHINGIAQKTPWVLPQSIFMYGSLLMLFTAGGFFKSLVSSSLTYLSLLFLLIGLLSPTVTKGDMIYHNQVGLIQVKKEGLVLGPYEKVNIPISEKPAESDITINGYIQGMYPFTVRIHATGYLNYDFKSLKEKLDTGTQSLEDIEAIEVIPLKQIKETIKNQLESMDTTQLNKNVLNQQISDLSKSLSTKGRIVELRLIQL